MDLKNKTIQTQLDHRSIREFTNETITDEIVDTLMEVARRTATSSGMQAYSIIKISDPILKVKIAEVCKQEYVERAPLLLIFVADQFRNHSIAVEKDPESLNTVGMDHFFQAFTDACIAAQNVVTAAESLELGTLYLGSILNDPQETRDLLKLPKWTFPVVGLAIGHPNQEPQLKPRMGNQLKVFENEYVCFENYLSEIKSYDAEMKEYYDLRDTNQRLDSFSEQIAKKAKHGLIKRQEMLNLVRDQGFDLKLK